MSESADYDPGPWKGHDFKSARSAYDTYAGRSYGDAVSAHKTAADLLPESISTDSESPLIILCDVTGSMGEWPATIFSKLPYLDIEGKTYLGQGMEICFGAVGDVNSDRYPLQMRPFSKGLDLTEQLQKLVIEGGGGGQTTESYEHGALYVSRNVKMPKATRRPIVIFIGDEQTYTSINPASAKNFANVDLSQNISDKEIFDELMKKCSVYLVRKPYRSSGSDIDLEIRKHWASLLGEDRIAELPDAARIVDVIFGILAVEVNRVEYFRKEIEDRQRADQVKTVYKSLDSICASAEAKHTGKSMMLNRDSGKPSRSLMDS